MVPAPSSRRKAPWAAMAALLSVSILGAAGCFMARPARAELGTPPAGLDASTVSFSSQSGSRIRAWLLKGRRNGGAVLLLHGVGANRLAMLGRARWLHRLGFTVLLPDFQAHGESPGDHITFGALESLDAHAALAFLRSHAPGERTGVIGVSMGGAAAVLGRAPLDADAMVLESVYPTIDDAVADRLNVWLGPFGFLGRALAPALIDVVGAQIDVGEDQLRPIDHVDSVCAPLFIVAGTADRYTTIAEARSIYDKARAPKEFWAVQGAGHEDLHAYAPAEYERRVGEFLLDNLGGRASGGSSVGSDGSSRSATRSDAMQAEERAGGPPAAQQLGAEQRACQ